METVLQNHLNCDYMHSHLCSGFINTAQKVFITQLFMSYINGKQVYNPAISPYKNSMITSLILCIVDKRIVFFSVCDILPAWLHDYFNIVSFII